MIQTPRSPHAILGVPVTATGEEVRSAYLQLVQQYPPERDAERFREIHAAYTQLSTPLAQAQALIQLWQTLPDLQQAVADADALQPRLAKLTLLALGNREADAHG